MKKIKKDLPMAQTTLDASSGPVLIVTTLYVVYFVVSNCMYNKLLVST